MNNLIRLFLAFILVTLCSCETNSKDTKTADKLPAISIDTDSDWGGNFKMTIVEKKVVDSFNLYTLAAVDKGIPIGIKLKVPRKIKGFGEGIEFQSIGDTSDNFLKSLSTIYKVTSKNKLVFQKTVSCPYAGLNDITYKGNGQKRDSLINYIKLFFEGKGENDYAELYLNINESERIVEFEEKDAEYRSYIITFFSTK